MNEQPDIAKIVAAEIHMRRLVGIDTYGQALTPHNGTDGLKNAYEEAMDLAIYLRQVIYERDGR